jgi:RNA polymerase sigma-70 factor (ECF subfamily)
LQRLEKVDARMGQLIEMRYFGGMTAEETSTALSIPVHVVRRELRLAQAWLRREMAGENCEPAQIRQTAVVATAAAGA